MTAHVRTMVGIAMLVMAGCAGGTADVGGKVTFQGKPVVFGTVVLIGEDGLPKSGPIQPDGTFRVSGAKTGTAKVAVSSPAPPGVVLAGKKAGVGRDAGDDRTPRDAGPPVSPEVVKGWFPIPDRFADPTRSGQTAEVKSGQPLEIDLK